MKRTWMLLSAVAFLLPVLVQAQSSSYEDDLYYNPKKAKVITEEKNYTPVSNATDATIEQTENEENENAQIVDNSGTSKARDVDEYNRHASINNDPEVLEGNDTDAVEDANGSTGAPYEYSERVRRFHDPDFTTQITGDGYLNVYVEDNADVNIYYLDDSQSGFMSPFFYDSYYYGSRWRWRNWSPYYSYYYDPWYSPWSYYDTWYYGGGFGGGWNPWYGGGGYYGYYGYSPYYYGGYYGYNHGGYSHHRYHLNSDQNRYLSNNGGGRNSLSRYSGSVASRSGSTSLRNGTALRSASSNGTASRAVTRSASRNTYSGSGVSGSQASTRSSSYTVSRSRTSSNGSSSSQSTVTRSSRPSSTSSSSYSTRSYSPSSSSFGGSSGNSSSGGGSSRGGGNGGRR